MKYKIHPKYQKVSVRCACGHIFTIFSTLHKDILNIDICSKCHPYYTGKQRVMKHGGRIEQFNKKFL